MNFDKKICKITKQLDYISEELDSLNGMAFPPPKRVARIKKKHAQVSEELFDFERIMKNRIWQAYGLEWYLEFEKMCGAIDDFTRTLVRVVSFTEDDIEICIPGWNPNRTVIFPLDLVPEHLQEQGKRFHCQCNVGVEDSNLLILTEFEDN